MLNSENVDRIDDLSKADLLKLVPDFLHRIIIHYALWFTEVRHQMGMPKALEMLDRVWKEIWASRWGVWARHSDSKWSTDCRPL
jgi:hypothetical protein